MAEPKRKKRDAATTRALNAATARLGMRIRALRTARGLTLEGLAEKSDLNPVHIWKIEKGQLNVELATLVALARGLRLEIEQLFVASEAAPARKPRLARRA